MSALAARLSYTNPESGDYVQQLLGTLLPMTNDWLSVEHLDAILWNGVEDRPYLGGSSTLSNDTAGSRIDPAAFSVTEEGRVEFQAHSADGVLRSRAVVPMVGAYECIGRLVLHNRLDERGRVTQFTDDDKATLAQVGDFVAEWISVVLERQHRLEMSSVISRHLHTPDIRDLANDFAGSACKMTNSPAAAVYVLDVGNDEVVRAAGLWGFRKTHAELLSFSSLQSLAGRVARGEGPKTFAQLTGADVAHPDIVTSEGFVSAVAAPIASAAIRGCIVAFSRRPRSYHKTTSFLLKDFGLSVGALFAAKMQAVEVDTLTEELGHAGHSLRNPLQAIGNNVKKLGRLLGGDRAEPEAARLLEETYLELERANRRVDSMLLSRQGILGLTGLNLESVAIGDVVQACVARHSPQAEGRSLKIVVYDSVKRLPVIVGDEDKLDLVIDNLLENAIKYAWRGHPIEIRGESTHEHIQFSVSDKGLGVPKDFYELIFKGYTRSPVLDQKRYIPGTGLGLRIVSAIVEAHGGTVSVDSVPFLDDSFRRDQMDGYRTTFTVVLPIRRRRAK